MDKQEKLSTAQLLRKGLRELAVHRPDKAIVTLRLAVEATPPSCSEELSRALYWLSVALLRLDKRELAIKSLSSAQKLRRRGYARSVYLRSINEYGMRKQPTPELDDFYAFMNIQMAAYLVKKSRSRFDSFQERETIFKIIIDAWKNLQRSSLLDDRDSCEKLLLFRKLKPSFPSFGFGDGAHRTVQVSFGSNRATGLDPTQRCVCGSGLPYGRCCGRVQSLGEL
ncbi:MAG TPA: SEC-C metal-binding domain-containing protein [Rectinemataceae bacterium]|nr:SEC-C metal-binding domain-containing protein [Rectinemataceae bacterium]